MVRVMLGTAVVLIIVGFAASFINTWVMLVFLWVTAIILAAFSIQYIIDERQTIGVIQAIG